jgi:two-component system, OmpR family, response regulator BaeR
MLKFRLPRLAFSQSSQVFSRGQLLDCAQADLHNASDSAVDTHIKNLRRKIHAVQPDIECNGLLYGIDYRFDAPACVSVS